MNTSNYLFLILLLVNLGLVIRFRSTKYFHFFFFISLVDPINTIIFSFDILFPSRFYFVITAFFYTVSFPLFERNLKLVFMLLIAFSIIFTIRYPNISAMASVSIFFSIIVFIIYSQIISFKKENKVELFTIFFSISIALNLIRIALLIEDSVVYYENAISILIADLVIAIIILVLGPKFVINFKKKKYLIETDPNELNMREKQIIKMISKGLTSQEIADKLFLSKKTVDYYRANIRVKLNITKKSELINFYTTHLESVEKSE